MPDVLTDRVAVITGGASGIGKATVLRFLDEGAKVVVGDYNAENGQALVDEVGDPDRLRFIRTDVAEEAEVEALIGAAVETFGGLDVLFNNAGVGGAFGPLTEISVDDWDRTFAVLVRSVFAGTKHGGAGDDRAGPRRQHHQHRVGRRARWRRRPARLLGGQGGGDQPDVLLGRRAVRSPHPRQRHLSRADPHPARPRPPRRPRARVGCPSCQPWPDAGLPEYIAGLALYLAGPDSTFVTGEAIRADGGAARRRTADGRPHRPVQHGPALRRLRRRHDRPPAGEAPARREA